MSSANCGWLFYKKPFLSQKENRLNEEIRKANEELLKTKYVDYNYPVVQNQSIIKLKTTYPGLVIGSGYVHSLKKQSENFDFCFYFDHTTGMPVIPGSSVKGTLRSLFGIGQTNYKDRYEKEKFELIKELLEKNEIDVKKLGEEIFEGLKDGEEIPLQKRDKFFDAFISSADNDGYIFADDYITPHENPLKDPVPNRMLKVRGDVEFTFTFVLHDGMITAKAKEKLFKELLLFAGIGAKTNVGYGQFEEVEKG